MLRGDSVFSNMGVDDLLASTHINPLGGGSAFVRQPSLLGRLSFSPTSEEAKKEEQQSSLPILQISPSSSGSARNETNTNK